MKPFIEPSYLPQRRLRTVPDLDSECEDALGRPFAASGIVTPNFAYLAHNDPRLVALGTQAEEHFAADPKVSLFKLRKFGELLVKRGGGDGVDGREQQLDIVNRLHKRGVVGAAQRTLFHDLRKSRGVHHQSGSSPRHGRVKEIARTGNSATRCAMNSNFIRCPWRRRWPPLLEFRAPG
jgi:hypothetical protein